MKQWIFVAGCVLGASISSVANAHGPAGPARAVDGDTLVVGGEEVRLYGIDAPELNQTCRRGGEEWSCGAGAASELARLIAGKNVFCDSLGTDQYQRTLAHCVAGTTDINKTMVSMGFAVAYRHYSQEYVATEMSARSSRRGIWGGTFESPDEYRHARRSLPRAQMGRVRSTAVSSNDWAARARADCNIKGNRNRKGQWIYHLPGMPYYDQTRPEEIFCSEAEAQAAGYRRAIVR